MRVLVTGAAGLIGGEICARLAARGHDVTALVHRNGVIRDNSGRILTGISVVQGDVCAENLGISAPQVDFIVHSAAITAFDAPPAAYEAVNIGGTGHVIALARATKAALIHVSTAYVCGKSTGIITETATGSDFVNGYEASKAAGEALVRASDVAFAIARPSIVVGDSAFGAINRFENIYMLFRLIAENRIRTLPAAPDASLDLVPIDHVAGGIVAMVEGFAAVRGRTLHLVGASPTPVSRIGDAIAAVPGLGTPHFVPPEAFDPADLPPVERRYHAAAAALYTNYLLRNPRFHTQNARDFGLECPPTGREWLEKLIGFCLSSGFVTAHRGKIAPVPSA